MDRYKSGFVPEWAQRTAAIVSAVFKNDEDKKKETEIKVEAEKKKLSDKEKEVLEKKIEKLEDKKYEVEKSYEADIAQLEEDIKKLEEVIKGSKIEAKVKELSEAKIKKIKEDLEGLKKDKKNMSGKGELYDNLKKAISESIKDLEKELKGAGVKASELEDVSPDKTKLEDIVDECKEEVEIEKLIDEVEASLTEDEKKIVKAKRKEKIKSDEDIDKKVEDIEAEIIRRKIKSTLMKKKFQGNKIKANVFEVGDTATVIDEASPHKGKSGIVKTAYKGDDENQMYAIDFDGDEHVEGFKENQLAKSGVTGKESKEEKDEKKLRKELIKLEDNMKEAEDDLKDVENDIKKMEKQGSEEDDTNKLKRIEDDITGLRKEKKEIQKDINDIAKEIHKIKKDIKGSEIKALIDECEKEIKDEIEANKLSEEAQKFVSDTIAKLMTDEEFKKKVDNESKEDLQKRAAAAAYSMAKEKGFKVPPNPNASVESAEIKIGDKDIAVTKDVKTEEKTQYKDYKNMPKEVKTTREEAKLDEEAKELMAKFTNAKNQLEADTKKMEDELDKIQKKYTPKLTEEGKVVSQLIDAVYAHFAEVKKINDIVKISENEFAGVVLKVKTSLKDKTFGEKEEKMMEDIEKKMEKLEDTLKKIQEENGAYNKITNEITVFKLEGSIVEIKASLISLVDMIKEASKKLGDITKSFLNFTKETQAISTMV